MEEPFVTSTVMFPALTGVKPDILEKGAEELSIAGDEAGAQARQVRALGEAVEDNAALIVVASEFRASL